MKLVEINKDNWLHTVLLTTNVDGKATVVEKFVASNALSIVQSNYETGWIVRGIEVDGKIIGFTMYGLDEETKNYWICRLMIDYTCQGKGYGKEAVQLVLDEMKQLDNCEVIYLSTEPNNEVAIKLYESFGFQKTGKINDGEAEFILTL
ncbi:diamine N-acetyltransferase [Psychrobacillus sp. OK028]|uniref:GNAT family N-acetyltransferase n=1 Tax=Psychrobacillus sp. OK028 TaxID=1884359 RepID=UPI0008800DBB|nr:GNAT family N-acetyltransferase [Psychrobacillus sp. OK028]SDO03987.1 diamine N-acetyltransferase [Psychrobacillus sp. OK028]